MQKILGKEVFSVTEVNNLARQTLEQMSFWILAEVSSYRGVRENYRYIYFDLKDSKTTYKIGCILEKGGSSQAETFLEDGQSVLVHGSLTLWEKDGRYQLYIHHIEPYGEGALLVELEKLKAKLEAKGYFDIENKKPLPDFPTNVAVISSKVSDAWHDFKKHTEDLFPAINLTLYNVLVQGDKSPKQIVRALKEADARGYDVIVIIRGGGSGEDLSGYNDEGLATAIYDAKTCVVCGVGHEKDITIAQLTADIAASTPTDAAKIIARDFMELEMRLVNFANRLRAIKKYFLYAKSQELDLLYQRLASYAARYKNLESTIAYSKQGLVLQKNRYMDTYSVRLGSQKNRLKVASEKFFSDNLLYLRSSQQRLTLLSPENTLSRGYAIAYSAGTIIKSTKQIDIDSSIKVKLHQGSFGAKVTNKNDKST